MNTNNESFLNNSLENFLQCIPNKKIVMFGAGREMVFCLDEIINLHHIDVAYVVDNDFRKWYTNYCGYEIKEPECLRQEKDNVIVLITSIYPYRIEKQLIRMGIKYYFSSLLFIERYIGKQQFMVFF